MNRAKARVSIGLPVYNGERFLAQALDSLLNQSYSDIELIISDNASTDRTQQICKEYELKDSRVHYYRNDTNVGVHENWNRVFRLSACDYFKWAAHDDLYAPEFIEECAKILNGDPLTILCCSRTKIIDENGQYVSDYEFIVETGSLRPHHRFYNMLAVDHWCFQQFGLIRSEILKKTALHSHYFGSDRNLLAELCLFGRIVEIPEFMFYRRDHAHSSSRLARGDWTKLKEYNPNNRSQTKHLAFRRFRELEAAVRHAPLAPSDRALCYLMLVRLAAQKSYRRFSNGMRALRQPGGIVGA